MLDEFLSVDLKKKCLLKTAAILSICPKMQLSGGSAPVSLIIGQK